MSYEIHFDHTKIDSTIFVRLGIKFDDSKEEEHFASLLKKEISRMISGTIKAAVSQEALDEFRMIKDAHAKKEWFEKNYPTYRQTQNEMFVQTIWACLTNSKIIKGVNVIRNNIHESVPLSSIGLEPKTLTFIEQHGMETIGDAIQNNAEINALEITYPKKVFELKIKILTLYLYDSEKQKPYCTVVSEAKPRKQTNDKTPLNMLDVYNMYCKESPDEVLIQMQLFILSCAEAFRNGEISEEELFVKTFVRKDLLNIVLELNECTSINSYYNATASDRNAFIAAWNKWKSTGKIEYQQWMIRMINTKGNILDSAKWIFHVIDVLLYPINSFSTIDTKLYSVPLQSMITGNTVYLMIDDYIIMDSVKKFDELFCAGKSYHIRYRSGIEADITINNFENNEYEGIGIIYGYMTAEQKITICEFEGRIRILFCKRNFSNYQVALETYFNPIPHPDWNQFNLADLEWSYQREAEYKSLRLPYMLGMVTKDQIMSSRFHIKGTPTRSDNIIDLSSITQNEYKQ